MTRPVARGCGRRKAPGCDNLPERITELGRRVARQHGQALTHGTFYLAKNLWTEIVNKACEYPFDLEAFRHLPPGRGRFCGLPVAVDRNLDDGKIVWRLEVTE